MTAMVERITPFGFAFARILIVMGLIPNGIRKITDFDTISAMMGGAAPVMLDGRLFPAQEPLFYFPLPELFLGAALVFDIVGAVLVIVGYRTRLAAGLLAGYIVAAMAIYHSDIGGPADVVAILRSLPLLGGVLLLSATGAGHWSLDEYGLRSTRQKEARQGVH